MIGPSFAATPVLWRCCLAASLIGGAALVACGRTALPGATNGRVATDAIAAAESARPLAGRTVSATASPSPLTTNRTTGDGVFPLVTSAEGRNAVARASLSTAANRCGEARGRERDCPRVTFHFWTHRSASP